MQEVLILYGVVCRNEDVEEFYGRVVFPRGHLFAPVFHRVGLCIDTVFIDIQRLLIWEIKTAFSQFTLQMATEGSAGRFMQICTK